MKKLSSIFIIVVLIFVCFFTFACSTTESIEPNTSKPLMPPTVFKFKLGKHEYKKGEDVILKVFLGTNIERTKPYRREIKGLLKITYVVIEGEFPKEYLTLQEIVKNNEKNRVLAIELDGFLRENYPLSELDENSVEIIFPADLFVGSEGFINIQLTAVGRYTNYVKYSSFNDRLLLTLKHGQLGVVGPSGIEGTSSF